jgi:hypothetical protein
MAHPAVERGKREAPRDSSPRRPSSASGEPKRSGEAIERGLECFAQEDFETAIDYFTWSLELPGNGFVRSPGVAFFNFIGQTFF